MRWVRSPGTRADTNVVSNGPASRRQFVPFVCPTCAVELPFPHESVVTCPRCLADPAVAAQVAADLLHASRSAGDVVTAHHLRQSALAWGATRASGPVLTW